MVLNEYFELKGKHKELNIRNKKIKSKIDNNNVDTSIYNTTIKFGTPLVFAFILIQFLFFNSMDYIYLDTIKNLNLESWFGFHDKIDAKLILNNTENISLCFVPILIFNIIVGVVSSSNFNSKNITENGLFLGLPILLIVLFASFYISSVLFSFYYVSLFLVSFIVSFEFISLLIFKKKIKNINQKNEIIEHEKNLKELDLIDEKILNLEKIIVKDKNAVLKIIDYVYDEKKYRDDVYGNLKNSMTHVEIKKFYFNKIKKETAAQSEKKVFLDSFNKNKIENT